MKKNTKTSCILPALFLGLLCFLFVMNLPHFLKSWTAARRKNPDDISKIIQTLETDYNDNFYEKMRFVSLNGAFCRAMDQRSVNKIVKLNNGHMTLPLGKRDMTKVADSIEELNRYLEKQDIPMLYFQAPGCVCALDPQLPTGVDDFSNANADALLALLNQRGVKTTDLRVKLHEDGLDHYGSFFKTDHHWTPETGFWAFTKIVDQLVEIGEGFAVDPQVRNFDNYDKTIYHKNYLGSRGERTGPYYGGVDDFTVLAPRFQTSLNLSALTLDNKEMHKTGAYHDVLLDMDKLDKGNFYSLDSYNCYIGGSNAYTQVKNLDTTNRKKILVFRDSFSGVVTPFMALGYQQVDWIDLRLFKGNPLKYIEQLQPDAVVLMYNPTELLNDKHYRYMKEA